MQCQVLLHAKYIDIIHRVLYYTIVMETKQIQKPFIVTRDGEIDKELSEGLNRPGYIAQFRGYISLQLEMAKYDILHGTNYRRIRNDLVREQRNRSFESRIGLVRK